MDKGCGWNKVIKDGMDALLSVVRAKQGLDDPQKGGRIGELLEEKSVLFADSREIFLVFHKLKYLT